VSVQAKIAKIMLRLQLSGWSEGSIEEQRAKQEKAARFARLPADVRCQPVSANGVAAEWIEAPGADLAVILYLHGGAYTLGSINTHRELVARLVCAAKVRGLVIDYRLAPEHPFPAALDDATTAYHWLLTQGFDPSQIVIGGDSAGGGLTLATLLALRDAGKPLPAGAVCISPWTDLTLSGASIKNKARADCVLDSDSLEMYARFYAGEHDRRFPLISPLFADLSGLSALLIQIGTEEILLDDATRCAENARKAGVDVTLEVLDGMFHAFQLVSFLPETKNAVGHIAEFVSQNLKEAELV
jgi:acetyl esterase/lipase